MVRRPNLDEYDGNFDDNDVEDEAIMDMSRPDEWETAMCPEELRKLLDERPFILHPRNFVTGRRHMNDEFKGSDNGKKRR